MTDPRGLSIQRLGSDGDGVATDGASTLFVRTALPGDVVTLGKPRRDGKILRADVKRILQPSPDRVAGPCDLAARCGGCPLMHASPELSARFKAGLVGHAASDAAFVVAAPDVGYRTRARLSFERGALGYLAPGSRSVLDVDHCAVLVSTLDAALTWVRQRLLPLLKGAGEIHLGTAEVDGEVDGALAPVLSLTTPDPQPPELYRLLETAVLERSLRGAEANIGGTRARFGVAVESSRDADGRLLEVPVGGFRQAHLDANRLLGNAVLRMGAPEGKRVLELHAGHGNFTLPLASRAASLSAVELGQDAVSALRANLARHQLNATVHGGDALGYLTKELTRQGRGTVDLVVLDPPRTGAKELMAPLLKLAPPRILYVSCAPSTLGRDLGVLREGGYRVSEAQAFDLFPRTAHVEAVVALERALTD